MRLTMGKIWLAVVLLGWGTFSPHAFAQGFAWETATPESQGMSAVKLEELRAEMARRGTMALLIIRNDKIVHEWYANGHGVDHKEGTASLAKAMIGGVSLAVAITDGKISLDDRAEKFVPEWRGDARKSRITIRQLGSHTSGLDDAEADGLPHDKLTGWKGDFWKRLAPPRDSFTLSRDQTEARFEPGERLQYSNPGIGMLAYCVTASLKGGSDVDIRTLLRNRIMRPIGVSDAEWSVGYGDTTQVGGLPLIATWGGAAFTPRAAAKVGRLLLREGAWEEKRILSAESVRMITGDAGLPGHCGMGFWTNADGRYSKLPRDTYYGAGAGDQLLIVVPSLKLIVVRNGSLLAPAVKGAKDVFEAYHDQRVKLLFEPVVEAVTGAGTKTSAAPYPASPVIQGVEWAPKESVIRMAQGGDNWPLTWGDDDQLYTAYGDGQGFVPLIDQKLSLGFARVEGTPPEEIKGINVRSPNGEQLGHGKDGKKASGILMVDGGLYLWVRNAGNSQLAWSSDHGKTWQWAVWKFETSFGCPTFLNFGKNYEGARDEYVYVYSHDNASAYLPADGMVLARVPRRKIREREAYEFFELIGENGDVVWTSNIARRGAVFRNAGRCYRSGVSYDAGLKRYLWVQILPGTEGRAVDTRFAGGFAIFDAPEPWGPWTTAYHTDSWDIGPGETSSFPTKWMSADGKTVHLVFSGDDCFSVRKAVLKVR